MNNTIYELTQSDGEKSYSALVYVGKTADNNFHNIAVKRFSDGSLGNPVILEYQTSMAKHLIDTQNYKNSSWQMDQIKITSPSQKTASFSKSASCPDEGVTIPEGGSGFNTSHISGFDFSDNIFNSDSGSYTPAGSGTSSGWVDVCYDTVSTSSYNCNGPNGGTPHGPEECGDPTTNFGGTGEITVVEKSCVPVYVTVVTHQQALPDYAVTLDNGPFITNCDLQRVRDGLQTETGNLTALGDEVLLALIAELDASTDFCDPLGGPVLPPTLKSSNVKSSKTANEEECPDPIDVNVVIPAEAWQLFDILNTLSSIFDTGVTDNQKNWILDPNNLNEVSTMLSFINEYGDFEDNKNLIKAEIDKRGDYTTSDFPGKDKGLPFEWWLNTDFISNSGNFDTPSAVDGGPDEKPNVKEAVLFAIFTQAAVLHVENSIVALDKARDLAISGEFPVSGLEDGKADAFRHAYWNALGTADFGSIIMKFFADAHEWGQTNTRAVDMDFHNNHEGRKIGGDFHIFSSDNDISDAVLTALRNGDLVYINGSGATVPTN